MRRIYVECGLNGEINAKSSKPCSTGIIGALGYA
nr:MAG TPA: hypothetical protein [Caudoviricetes sp.]